MAERLKVVRRGFCYPADADSLAIIRAAGGLSKVAADVRAKLRWKEVGIGEYCDDMPEPARSLYLKRGDLELVKVEEAPAPRVQRPRSKEAA